MTIHSTHRIRIIAGQYRGRKINVLNRPGLRPSPDRVRETVFNWLQFEITGAYVLDAFAGSGAMGLEALSRGASSVLFCDNDAIVCQAIRDNLIQWNISHARVIQADSINLDNSATRYDVIFLDPPFIHNLQQQVLDKFSTVSWLKPQGKIYLEIPYAHENISLPQGWYWHKKSKAGRIWFGLIAQENHSG